MAHSATHGFPDYQWYGNRRSIHDFRVCGLHIEAIKDTHLTNLADIIETGYFLETPATILVIRYWYPSRTSTIWYCTTAEFNEFEILYPSRELCPGSKIHARFS